MSELHHLEFIAAIAEQEYADDSFLELRNKLSDLLPILTRDELEELSSIIDVELRETIDLGAYVKRTMPF